MTRARWLTFLLHAGLLAGLLVCIYLSVRRGVGTLCFGQGTPDAIHRAIRWDPSNPQYYDALATLTHFYADAEDPNDVIHLYQTAVHLSPHDASFWADLGSAYDWAGRRQDALVAFQRAHFLAPNSPEIHWRIANFDFRDGRSQEGLRALQTVLRGNSASQRMAFELATRAAPDRQVLLELMLPQQAPLLFAYLDFEVEKDDMVGAAQAWNRIIVEKSPFELRDAFPYLDALIRHMDVARLAQAWSALAERFPAHFGSPVTPSNLVTNGDFARDILNGGLDWRVVPVQGAVVSLKPKDGLEGGRVLQIAFTGSRNLDYSHVLQYVLVQPNTRYSFSARMRVQNITSDSGPRFQICDAHDSGSVLASTQNLIGTLPWSEQHAEFTTKADCRLLLIRVVRPASTRLDNQISGAVWIARVRLSAAP